MATRAFSPGDVVLDDAAYSWAIIGDQLGAHCDCCCQPVSSALRQAAAGVRDTANCGVRGNA